MKDKLNRIGDQFLAIGGIGSLLLGVNLSFHGVYGLATTRERMDDLLDWPFAVPVAHPTPGQMLLFGLCFVFIGVVTLRLAAKSMARG